MDMQLITTEVNQENTFGCKNIRLTEDFIKRYQQSTKNAIEQVLNMGEAVSNIYIKTKSGELDNKDLEYFCKNVGLDPKGSTFRKYKAIGNNSDRFRQYMQKLPSSFSVLYEIATLDADDFEKYVVRKTLSNRLTLEEFKKITKKSAVLAKNNLYNPPALNVSSQSVSNVIKKINRFSIRIVRDLNKSDFDLIIEQLTEYRNKGWIQFSDALITEYIDEEVAEVFQSNVIEDVSFAA
jgi:hypothetical protein